MFLCDNYVVLIASIVSSFSYNYIAPNVTVYSAFIFYQVYDLFSWFLVI